MDAEIYFMDVYRHNRKIDEDHVIEAKIRATSRMMLDIDYFGFIKTLGNQDTPIDLMNLLVEALNRGDFQAIGKSCYQIYAFHHYDNLVSEELNREANHD